MMRRSWDAAVALDPAARNLDEGRRLAVCQPEALRRLVQRAGLEGARPRAIDVPTTFAGFRRFLVAVSRRPRACPGLLRRAAARSAGQASRPPAGDAPDRARRHHSAQGPRLCGSRHATRLHRNRWQPFAQERAMGDLDHTATAGHPKLRTLS
jgi:hypothetical protein